MIPSAYSNTILSDTPALYYRLGELSGSTVYDSSGNKRDGTINGGVALGVQGALQKDRDTAMLFDGSSGYIASNYTTSSLSAFTVECWVKLNNVSLASYPAIATNDFSSTSNKGFGLFLAPPSDGVSGYFVIGLGASHPTLAFGNSVLAPYAWYHIVAVYNGSSMIVYVNGQQSATTSASGTISAPTYDIQIGRYASDSGYLSAAIDEFAFYTSSLSPSLVLSHYNAGINTLITSSQDTFLNKFQIVKVYGPSGNFIDVILDAPLLNCKETINAAADTARMMLPRPFDAFDGAGQPGSKGTIVSGNVVQWWLYGAGLPVTGLLKFQGKVDAIAPRLEEGGGQSVEVTVVPFSQVLGDHGVGTTAINFGTAGSSSTYIDTAAIFRAFFTGSYIDRTGASVAVTDPVTSQAYGYPYTMDPASLTSTGQFVQFAFQSQKLTSAINDILALSTVSYYFRMNQNLTTLFQKIATDPMHTLLLGQHITALEYIVDNVPRKNVIVVIGAGSVKATATGSSVSSIGERVYYKSDDRITDNNTAQVLASGLLSILDREQVRAKVKIPDNRGSSVAGPGYDIEQFLVGQTVKIVDARASRASIEGQGSLWGGFVWGSGRWGAPTGQTIWGAFDWGEAAWSAGVGTIFNVVVPIMAIDYHWHYVELELGFRAPTLSRALFDLELRFQDAVLA